MAVEAFLGALAGAVVGPVAVDLFGKIFDTRAGRARKCEDDRDEDVLEVCALIDELLLSLDDYWSHSAVELGSRDGALAARITSQLHHINLVQSFLFRGIDAASKNTRAEWMDLHKLATGGDFMSPERLADTRSLAAMRIISFQLRRGIKERRRKLPRSFLA